MSWIGPPSRRRRYGEVAPKLTQYTARAKAEPAGQVGRVEGLVGQADKEGRVGKERRLSTKCATTEDTDITDVHNY